MESNSRAGAGNYPAGDRRVEEAWVPPSLSGAAHACVDRPGRLRAPTGSGEALVRVCRGTAVFGVQPLAPLSKLTGRVPVNRIGSHVEA